MDEKKQVWTITVPIVTNLLIDFGRPVTVDEAIKLYSKDEYEDVIDWEWGKKGYVQEIA